MPVHTSIPLADALRQTAQNIQAGAPYQWGHMGSCNCGNLAQVLTPYTNAEIHSFALASREGDWSEQTDEYCPTSNLPMDKVIDILISKGLSFQDLKNLEYLRDEKVLSHPSISSPLQHNKPEDVVTYLLVWAEQLEQESLTEPLLCH